MKYCCLLLVTSLISTLSFSIGENSREITLEKKIEALILISASRPVTSELKSLLNTDERTRDTTLYLLTQGPEKLFAEALKIVDDPERAPASIPLRKATTYCGDA